MEQLNVSAVTAEVLKEINEDVREAKIDAIKDYVRQRIMRISAINDTTVRLAEEKARLQREISMLQVEEIKDIVL